MGQFALGTDFPKKLVITRCVMIWIFKEPLFLVFLMLKNKIKCNFHKKNHKRIGSFSGQIIWFFFFSIFGEPQSYIKIRNFDFLEPWLSVCTIHWHGDHYGLDNIYGEGGYPRLELPNKKSSPHEEYSSKGDTLAISNTCPSNN